MAVTKSNVLGALNRYIRAYESVGITLDFRFQEGSSTQGVAYRIEMKDGSEAPGTSHNGFLGHTRSEAWHTLLTAARAIEDMNHLKNAQAQASEAVYFKNEDGSIVGFEV